MTPSALSKCKLMGKKMSLITRKSKKFTRQFYGFSNPSVTRQILGRQRHPEVGSKVLYSAKMCTFRAHNSESSLPESTP